MKIFAKSSGRWAGVMLLVLAAVAWGTDMSFSTYVPQTTDDLPTTQRRMAGGIAAISAMPTAIGVTTGAAVVTDADGTVQQYLRGLVKLSGTSGLKLAAGSALLGSVGIDQTTPGTTNLVQMAVGSAASATLVNSSVAEASHVIKASAGTLVALVGYNNKSSAQFIQVFNSTTVPADTAVPILTFTALANSNFSVAIPICGMPLTTGISVSNSSTWMTKTIGAADCSFTAVIK